MTTSCSWEASIDGKPPERLMRFQREQLQSPNPARTARNAKLPGASRVHRSAPQGSGADLRTGGTSPTKSGISRHRQAASKLRRVCRLDIDPVRGKQEFARFPAFLQIPHRHRRNVRVSCHQAGGIQYVLRRPTRCIRGRSASFAAPGSKHLSSASDKQID